MNTTITAKKPLLQRLSHTVILVTITLIFVTSGVSKFMPIDAVEANFAKWGLAGWKEIIGAAEIGIAVLYLIRKTHLSGTILFSVLMAGAMVIHHVHDEPYFLNAAIFLVLWLNYFFLKP